MGIATQTQNGLKFTDSQLYINTPTSTVMTILSGGNVGIGTTSPGYKLDVLGTSAAVLGVRSSGFAGIDVISDRDSGNLGGVRFRHSGDTAQSVEILGLIGGSVDFKLGGSGEIAPSSKVRFDPDGNVGIGTTSPDYKLDVDGDIRARDVIRVFGNTVTTLPYNSPEEVSVNLGTYNNQYSYIDLATSHVGGSWIDFSKADGTDYGGRIRYVNSSDQFQFFTNNSLHMVLSSAGNVGIGTTIPGAKLEINTGSAAGGFKLYGSNSSYTAAFIANTGSGNAGIYMDGINGDFSGGDYGFIGQEDSGYMLYNIGASSPSPYHVFTGGNVGIGTNSPGYKLQVSGGDAQIVNGSTAALYMNNTTNYLYGDVNGVSIVAAGDNFRIKTNDSERLRITQNGNVGIGITNPAAQLDVSGTASGSKGTIQAKSTYSSSSYFSAFRSKPSDGSSNVNGGLWMGAISDNNSTISSGAIYRSAGKWRPATSTASVLGMNSSGITFYTDNGLTSDTDFVPSERMRIDLDGNVGLGGATQTNRKLKVTGHSQVDGTIYVTGAATTYSVEVGQSRTTAGTAFLDLTGEVAPDDYGLRMIRYGGANALSKIIHTGTNNLEINSENGGDVVFTNGNVGIGTTSPSSLFSVAGNVILGQGMNRPVAYDSNSGNFKITPNSGGWATGYFFNKSDSTFLGGFGAFGGANTHSYFYIGLDYSSPIMTLKPAGNVGIGDTTPSYKLDVAGTIRATGDVIAYSDARVKDNVVTIENALDKVTQLRGVSYNRNDVEDKTTKIGVIAQEVLEVLPEVVQQDDEGKYSVAYGNMVGLLIESIKELKAEIDELKSRL
jgi:hypothetical protein